MKYVEHYSNGFGRVQVLAVMSVIALVVVSTWSFFDTYTKKKDDLSAKTPVSKILSTQSTEDVTYNDSADGLSFEMIKSPDTDAIATLSQNTMAQVAGSYLIAKQEGNYTPEKATQIGTEIGTTLRAPVSFVPFTETEIKSTSDVSYPRMIQYRTELQTTLAPLMENKRSEFEIYGEYVETKDAKYLDELRAAALNYNKAASNSKSVVVPLDAISYHVGIVNAMSQFAATLEAMADHAQDPIASAALLRTYNQAEQDMYTSFNDLAQYYVHKKQ